MTPNADMAQLSDTLFTIAIAIYALAMVGYTAEYAFGRRGRVAATVPSPDPARALIGSGAPARPERQARPPADPTRDASSSEQGTFADRIGRAAFLATLVGAAVHTASVVVRAGAVDAVPWSNMYEFASVAGLVAVLAFAMLMWKAPQIRHLGGFILLRLQTVERGMQILLLAPDNTDRDIRRRLRMRLATVQPGEALPRI